MSGTCIGCNTTDVAVNDASRCPECAELEELRHKMAPPPAPVDLNTPLLFGIALGITIFQVVGGVAAALAGAHVLGTVAYGTGLLTLLGLILLSRHRETVPPADREQSNSHDKGWTAEEAQRIADMLTDDLSAALTLAAQAGTSEYSMWTGESGNWHLVVRTDLMRRHRGGATDLAGHRVVTKPPTHPNPRTRREEP